MRKRYKKRWGNSSTSKGYTAKEITNNINNFLNSAEGSKLIKDTKNNAKERGYTITKAKIRSIIRANTKELLNKSSDDYSNWATLTGRSAGMKIKKAIDDATSTFRSNEYNSAKRTRELISTDKFLEKQFNSLAGPKKRQQVEDLEYLGKENKTQIWRHKKGFFVYINDSPDDEDGGSTISITTVNMFGV